MLLVALAQRLEHGLANSQGVMLCKGERFLAGSIPAEGT
jgi:hypothetical protein